MLLQEDLCIFDVVGFCRFLQSHRRAHHYKEAHCCNEHAKTNFCGGFGFFAFFAEKSEERNAHRSEGYHEARIELLEDGSVYCSLGL